jgi:hypothetical protein
MNLALSLLVLPGFIAFGAACFYVFTVCMFIIG